MRFFRSEETLHEWQAQHKLGGEYLSLGQTWQLSQAWYGTRMNLEFHGRTPAQIEELFRSLNLTSDFWHTASPA